MFAYRHDVGKYLSRMEFICQAVPDRDSRVLGEIFDNRLLEAAILDTVIHSSENACRISDALLLADLRSGRVKEGGMHTEIGCSNFK